MKYNNALEKQPNSCKFVVDNNSKISVNNLFVQKLLERAKKEDDLDKKVNYCKKIVAKYDDLGIELKEEVADLQYEIGNTYYINRNYEVAIEWKKQSIQTYESLGKDEEVAEVEKNICLFYERKDNYIEAIEWYKQLIEKYQKLKDNNYISITDLCKDIGKQYFLNDEYEEAVKWYEKVLEKKKGADLAFLHKCIGNCYFRIDQYDKAISHYQESSKEYEKCEYISIAYGIEGAKLQMLIGDCYFKKGNYEKAKDCYEQMLEFEKNKLIIQEENVALLQDNIGDCYFEIGKYKSAIYSYKKAMEIYVNIDNTEKEMNLWYWILDNPNLKNQLIEDRIKYK